MKRILKLLSVSGLLACIVLFGACSEHSEWDSNGNGGGSDGYCRVIKGPVAGATVFFASGAPSETTKADGKYTCTQNSGVTTTGGYYRDMNGQIRLAPDMSAPAGYSSNVTPLTTLYNNASPAVKTELAALLSSPRFDSAVLGQVTNQNLAIAKLNEGIGEALTQLQEQLGHAPSAEYLATFAAQVLAMLKAAGNTVPSSAAIAAALPAHSEIRAGTMNDIKSDVVAIADKVVVGGTLGAALPSATVTPPVVDPVDVWTGNSAQNPYNAVPVAAYFAVHPISTYLYTIAGFGADDRLVFDEGTAIGLTNVSGTDGIIDIIGSKDGEVATIRLTGIAPALDGAIYGVESFNAVFGPGALVWTSGNISCTAVGVSAANAQPYDASAGAICFYVHPTGGLYTFTVINFGAGDRIIYDGGTAIGLTNINFADGIVDVIGSLNGNAATMRLTGLDPAVDGVVYGVSSFNAEFGPGSLVSQ